MEGITQMVNFKQRLEGADTIWRKRVSGNGNSMCKGPEEHLGGPCDCSKVNRANVVGNEVNWWEWGPIVQGLTGQCKELYSE